MLDENFSDTDNLLKQLLDRNIPHVIKERLINSNHDIVCDSLNQLLIDEDLDIRDLTLMAFLQIDTSLAVKRISSLIEDPIDSWRWRICAVLGQFGNSTSVMPLIKVLLNDSSQDVRFMAAMALESIGDIRAISSLRQVVHTDRGTDYEGRQISEMAKEAINAIQKRI